MFFVERGHACVWNHKANTFMAQQHDFLKIICKKREYLRADLLSGILKPLLRCCFLSILFKWLTVFVLKITIIPEYINDGRKSYILIVLE